MKNLLTEVVFILDRSGSMGGLEQDTIKGYNSLIRKQKDEEGRLLLSTVLFDHVSEVLHDRVDLKEAPLLTSKDYFVRGSTALLDALGSSIRHIGNIHKYCKKKDSPDKTLFIINTDGYENSSVLYNFDQIRKMIEHQKSRYGWEFLFLGANIDAIATARRFGIDADRAVDYHCDERGVELNYSALCEAVSSFRLKSEIAPEWKANIEKDYHHRKPKSRR